MAVFLFLQSFVECRECSVWLIAYISKSCANYNYSNVDKIRCTMRDLHLLNIVNKSLLLLAIKNWVYDTNDVKNDSQWQYEPLQTTLQPSICFEGIFFSQRFSVVLLLLLLLMVFMQWMMMMMMMRL